MKKFYLASFVLFILFGFLSCDPREETKQPTACFTYSPNEDIKVGDEITFNADCSTDVETYRWNFGDGSAERVGPTANHIYEQSGTWKVLLTVVNKNLEAQTEENLIVTTDVKACFTMDPNPATIGEYITFSNCSENADSYEWDLNGDGEIDSEKETPVFKFNVAGTFNTKLIAKAGISTDEIVHQLTINEPTVDVYPKQYDGIPGWDAYYVNEFDGTDDDWHVGSADDYDAYKTDGLYYIENRNTESDYIFRTNATVMPEDNYDFESEFKLTYNNQGYGNGILWAENPDDGNYFIYKYSYGQYRYGDTQRGWWCEWTEKGNYEGYNKLTARKYNGRYYIFLNEIFIGEYDSLDDFGEKIGFLVGREVNVTINFIGIWTMNFNSNKSASKKVISNYGIGSGNGDLQKIKTASNPASK